MHFQTLLPLALIAVKALAAPAPAPVAAPLAAAAPISEEDMYEFDERALCPASYTAKFDNLRASAIAPTGPPNPYRGLDYHGFNVVKPIIIQGVESGVNGIGFGSLQVNQPPPPHNIRKPKGTHSFTAHGFYFGCSVAPVNGAAPVPAACKVKAIGRKLNGVDRVGMTYEYAPTSGLTAVKLPDTFDGLQGLQFVLVSDNVTDGALSVTLDNVKYTTYKKCAA